MNIFSAYISNDQRDAVDASNATCSFLKSVMFHTYWCCTLVILQIFRMARLVRAALLMRRFCRYTICCMSCIELHSR